AVGVASLPAVVEAQILRSGELPAPDADVRDLAHALVAGVDRRQLVVDGRVQLDDGRERAVGGGGAREAAHGGGEGQGHAGVGAAGRVGVVVVIVGVGGAHARGAVGVAAFVVRAGALVLRPGELPAADVR